MTSKTISDAVTNISIRYIEEAADYSVATKVRKPMWVKWIAAAACLCLMVLTAIPFFQNATEPNKPPVQASPAHFYLAGELYCYHGQTTFSLPDGYEYVGEVKNVGETFSGLDFEGNVDGSIYMSEEFPETAYFKWSEWNETVDGPSPYLLLVTGDYNE